MKVFKHLLPDETLEEVQEEEPQGDEDGDDDEYWSSLLLFNWN